MNNNETPRIYVACLAAYNAGLLHGKWIDADQDAEDIMEEIQTMLKASPEPFAEEWAIHDYENFGSISLNEYESIEKVAELGQAIVEHGLAIAAYYNYQGTLDDFEEDFCGVYESEEDFVEDWLAETGQLEAIEKAGLKSYYIDFEAMARDWFIDSFFSIKLSYQQVYVFHY
jgi:antirestriction protein